MITWSPRGSYIATWHEQGIAIWGGENFEKQGAFAHSNAKLIDFSPCEKYILTWNEDSKKVIFFFSFLKPISQECCCLGYKNKKS